jgi:hypothetical protein
MAVGLLHEPVVWDFPVRVVGTVSLTAGSDIVTSAGLFVADDERRIMTVDGSGLPAETWIDTVIDANTVQLSKNATGSGTFTRTATLDGKAFFFVNQGGPNPVAEMIDAEHLRFDEFTTGTTGFIWLVLYATIHGWPNTSADNYLEMSLLDAAGDVILPNTPGGQGRRVNLHHGAYHGAKLDTGLALLPNTTYTDTYFGAAGGNQSDPAPPGIEPVPDHGWIIIVGGTYGAATMEVWDLDDGTGPVLRTGGPAVFTLAGVTPELLLDTQIASAGPAEFTLAGVTPSLVAEGTVVGGPAVFTLTGQTPELIATVVATALALTLTGQTPTATNVLPVTAGPAVFTLTGQTPTATGSDPGVIAGPATFTLAGVTPTVTEVEPPVEPPTTLPRHGPCTMWTTRARVRALPVFVKLAAQTPPVVPSLASLDSMIETASWLLWDASGRQWPGTCTDTVLICGRCGCNRLLGRHWSCPRLTGPGLELPFSPVLDVASVYEIPDPPDLADAVLIDASSYVVEDSRWLIRVDDEPWPSCVLVTFDHGGDPPEAGQHAATVLAGELLAAITPGATCRLPERAQSVTRQGVSVAFLDKQQFFADGLTGLYMVDLFLSRFRNQGGVTRSRILDPNKIPKTHRRT